MICLLQYDIIINSTINTYIIICNVKLRAYSRKHPRCFDTLGLFLQKIIIIFLLYLLKMESQKPKTLRNLSSCNCFQIEATASERTILKVYQQMNNKLWTMHDANFTSLVKGISLKHCSRLLYFAGQILCMLYYYFMILFLDDDDKERILYQYAYCKVLSVVPSNIFVHRN